MPLKNGQFIVEPHTVPLTKLSPEDYKFLLDAYTGLGGFKSGDYLIQHKREEEDKFNRRKQLTIYPNYIRKIVDTFTAHIFKRPPQRKTTPEYERFINNVDKRGTHIDDFMRKIFKLTCIYGTVFIIIDKPSEQAKTRYEELEKGLLPYATIRLPTQLHSYSLDNFGNLQEITFQETTSEGAIYRTFTTTEWRITDTRKKVIAQGNHNLSVVPVARIAFTEQLLPSDIISEPFIWNIAKLNFEIYNLISEIREILRNQTFPILTLPTSSPEEATRYKSLKVGTENGLFYNPEYGGKPDFIAPPPGPVEVYIEYLKLIIEQIYKSVNLEFVLGTQSQKSGVALEFEFQNLNAMLAQFTMCMEQAEYEIAYLVEKWNGKDGFKGSINYTKDFSYRDAERQLKLALDSLTANIGKLFENEVKKFISRLILNDFSDDATLRAIDKEIEGIQKLDEQLKNT